MDASGNIVDYDTLKKDVRIYEEDNYLLSNQYEELKKNNNQLQNKISELEININDNGNSINELTEQNNKILAENNELNTKIEKYKAIINTVNDKLNEINNNQDLNVDNEKYEEELKTVLAQFENKLKSTSATSDANTKTIEENTEQINNLTNENKELKLKIQQLEQANQDKDNQLLEKEQELLEKDQKFEQYKLENEKAIEQVIEDTKNTDVVEFKNKLAEILGTIYGQSLAQAIITGAKLGETQPEITISEEDKLVKENKLAEQVIKTPEVNKSVKEQLSDSEFEIYSAKKRGSDKKILKDILGLNTQGKEKIDKLDKFKRDVNTLLNTATLENLDKTKTKIQNLINDITGKDDGELRISNSGKLQFGGDF